MDVSLILSQRSYSSRATERRPLLLLCGFGGRIWQLRRMIEVLRKAGYDVTAIDFSKTVLSTGDPKLLPQLVDEVVAFAEDMARSVRQPVTLVGVSLGALLSLNIVRRSELFESGVLITGGDIAKIAQKLYPRRWPQSYDELAAQWRDINMCTDPAKLRGKRLLFVIHPSRRLIDIADVRAEIVRQQAAGNYMAVIERPRFDHIGTIINETVLRPGQVLEYIRQVAGPD